jgi:zinc protease
MISFEKFKLANGLRIIHHFDDSTPLAVVNVLYDVGARDEEADKTGFAHLFEHLMFGGSENIPDYDTPLQLVGGENNAFTNNDITNYYLTLPADNIETAFWLESDRMLNLAFSEESLAVQKNVVIEEFKQRYLNQPYGDVWLKLRPLAYKVHPYQWATIGKDLSHIENANLEDVKAFFERFYSPNNAILVVAGNIELEKVIELSEKWFAPIPGQPLKTRHLPNEPHQDEERKETVRADVPADAIYMAFHTCARNDPEYYSADLLSDVFSRGKSARLYHELVKKQRLFTEINAYISGDLDAGLFVIEGKLVKGVKVEAGEQAIRSEIEKIQNELITDEELTKVKNKTEATLTFSEMNILNKAMNLAYCELLGDAGLINCEIANYNKVTTEDIRRAAKHILVPTNCSTLYYLAN